MDVTGVKIDYLGHSGFLIVCRNGKRIAIDPYGVSDGVGKVDLILVTHGHYDHCSIKDLGKLSKKGTMIVIPADAQSKITRIEGVDMKIIQVGDEIIYNDIKIEAIAAYNIEKEFHPRREGWLGFLIKMNGIVIYHAGDTDHIPEMSHIGKYAEDGSELVALLPVSGQYVMDAEDAASAAASIKSTLAIPMHYGAGIAGTLKDAQKFVDICNRAGIKAKILEKI